jgi:hypothetical protein
LDIRYSKIVFCRKKQKLYNLRSSLESSYDQDSGLNKTERTPKEGLAEKNFGAFGQGQPAKWWPTTFLLKS